MLQFTLEVKRGKKVKKNRTMKKNEIIGTIIFGISVAGLSYLFFGYIKPRMDFEKEKSNANSKTVTTK